MNLPVHTQSDSVDRRHTIHTNDQRKFCTHSVRVGCAHIIGCRTLADSQKLCVTRTSVLAPSVERHHCGHSAHRHDVYITCITRPAGGGASSRTHHLHHAVRITCITCITCVTCITCPAGSGASRRTHHLHHVRHVHHMPSWRRRI